MDLSASSAKESLKKDLIFSGFNNKYKMRTHEKLKHISTESEHTDAAAINQSEHTDVPVNQSGNIAGQDEKPKLR